MSELGFLAALGKARLATLGSPSHVAVACWNWAAAAHIPPTRSRFTRHPALARGVSVAVDMGAAWQWAWHQRVRDHCVAASFPTNGAGGSPPEGRFVPSSVSCLPLAIGLTCYSFATCVDWCWGFSLEGRLPLV